MTDEAFAGIIFDLNGVLWCDGHLQEEAWRRFSAECRGRPLSHEEMAVHVHGRSNRHTLEYLLGRSIAPGELQRLAGRKEALYQQLCLGQGAAFRLSPGAEELLGWLAAHAIPRTIATASGGDNVVFFLEHLRLARWFSPSRIAYDDGTLAGKPAPDLYLRAADNLGLAPAQCVVVEDSHSGLEAARAASIGHIIAMGPAPTHPQLAQIAGVHEVVEDLRGVHTELFAPLRPNGRGSSPVPAMPR